MLRHLPVTRALACALALAACTDASSTLTAPVPPDARTLAHDVAGDVAPPVGVQPRAALGAVAVVEPTLPAELPVDERLAITGRTFRPATTSELWAAIREAVPGDHILLRPGASYVGYFNLPRKAARTGFVTIRTDLPESEYPAGVRVTPARATRLAKIVAQGRNDPAIRAHPGARGWRFVGVEITVHDSVKTLGAIVMLGDNSARVLDSIPSDIVFDRTYIHAWPHQGVTRCVFINSGRTALLHSTISECHRDGFDSYGVGGVSSPGPVRIENNRIEGAGMGIFTGGSDPKVPGLSPSDFVIRNNHVTRPAAWKGVHSVKNLLEFKHMKRALVEGNLFENNWKDAQSGMAILFKSTNQQNRAPWSTTQDVTFRNNVVRNSPNGISIHASPEVYPVVPTARIKIEKNLFYNIGSYAGTTGGRMIVMGGELKDIQLLNNTMIHNSPATHAVISDPSSSLSAARFRARANVLTLGTSGWMSSGKGQGIASLDHHWRDTWEFTGNVLIGDTRRPNYPVNTLFVATLLDAGFTNPSIGDFSLLASSPVRNQGTTGADPGAPVATLLRHIARIAPP